MTNPTTAVLTPQVATILASYNCTAACENCCFDSHPGIRQRLPLDEILRFIDQAAGFETMRLVVFSGGECFLLKDDLDAAVDHATRLGLSTRCVTNAYWARTEEIALRRLEKLKAAGLRELNVSTGDFHQRFVPQKSVINACVAALRLGLDLVVMVELQRERKVRAAAIQSDERIVAAARRPGRGLFKVVESPWMPMTPGGNVPQPSRTVLGRDNLHRKTGCDSVLTTIVATPSGRLGMCCGLSREKIPELNEDLPKEQPLKQVYFASSGDFMKIWLFVEGPERILAWAASKDATIAWEGKYAHRCHACLALFKDERALRVIRDHYSEKVPNVLLRYSLMVRAGLVEAPEFDLFRDSGTSAAERRQSGQRRPASSLVGPGASA